MVKSIGQLRTLLVEMEAALGLVELSQNERDVYYAISALAEANDGVVRTEAIREHALVGPIPQASYHRALRALVQRGFIGHAPDTKSGAYVVMDEKLA